MQKNCYWLFVSPWGRRRPTKMFLVMKLTALLLTVAFVQAYAGVSAQRVTLSGKESTLEKVFTAIEKQTGYVVFGNKELFSDMGSVSVSVRDMPLREVLDLVLKGRPYMYEIEGKTVFVSRKNAVTIIPVIVDPVPVEDRVVVSGIVRDTAGILLVGATIMNKRTKETVVTNLQGTFSVEAQVGDVLVCSFVGFVGQEVRITNLSLQLITLVKSVSPLDEVQVIAYGTTTRRLSTGNINTVKAADLEKAPVSNPLLALQGRVPGVFIEQTTGVVGGGLEIQIQGRNSISNGNAPLYIVDGVPFPANMPRGLFPINLGGNPFNYINSQDIESIDILKDADATAILGSRAANGAILITTKRGKAGKTTVNINIQQGFGQVAKKIPMMNTEQYLALRREAFSNDGLPVPDKSTTPAPGNYDLTFWDQNRNVDWQKELIGKKAQYTDAQAGISGGNTNANFLARVNYHRETTVFPGDYAAVRGSAYVNARFASNNNRFTTQLSASYTTDKTNLPGFDVTNAAITLAPNAPALFNADGSLNWAPLPNGNSTWWNPLAFTTQTYTARTNNLIASAALEYRLLKKLVLKTDFSYNRLGMDEVRLTPMTYYRPETRKQGNFREAAYSNGMINTWVIEPQVSYEINKDFGKMEFFLGSTFQQTKNNVTAFSGIGYSNDDQLENLSAATTVKIDKVLQSVYNYTALSGRINYNYKDRYLINLSGRRDGSSRFGSENLFHNFYSIGAAWIISNENWFTELDDLINFTKLKASYGTSGNDQIGDYSFMTLYNYANVYNPYGGGTALVPGGHSNPYLQWEETRKLNAGIDIGLFNSQVMLEVDCYLYRSSNQLLAYPLPVFTGFGSVKKNREATVQNSGIEIQLNTRNIQSKKFQWSSNINFTINRNKLVSYPGLETSSYKSINEIGKPLNITKVYAFGGVNPTTGAYQFINADGSLTSSPDYVNDRTIIIDETPKFYGGIGNTITYKNITLDFLVRFVKQTALNPIRFGGNPPGLLDLIPKGNQPTELLNRWQKPDDLTSIQRASTGINYLAALDAAQRSDAAYSDASFLQIKNVSLSWAFPGRWINRLHIQQAKFYFQAQNLFTLSKFPVDPEVRSIVALPSLRVMILGVQMTL